MKNQTVKTNLSEDRLQKVFTRFNAVEIERKKLNGGFCLITFFASDSEHKAIAKEFHRYERNFLNVFYTYI